MGNEEAEWFKGLLAGHCWEKDRGRRKETQVQREGLNSRGGVGWGSSKESPSDFIPSL